VRKKSGSFSYETAGQILYNADNPVL